MTLFRVRLSELPPRMISSPHISQTGPRRVSPLSDRHRALPQSSRFREDQVVRKSHLAVRHKLQFTTGAAGLQCRPGGQWQFTGPQPPAEPTQATAFQRAGPPTNGRSLWGLDEVIAEMPPARREGAICLDRNECCYKIQ